jgi:hypothetical protein
MTEGNGDDRGRLTANEERKQFPEGMYPQQRLTHAEEDALWSHVMDYVENAGMARNDGPQQGSITSRNELFRAWRHNPLRLISEECGYPDTMAIEPDTYRTFYDREPIATLVCQLLPRESWQVSPRVYEDEDPQNETPFEKRWAEIDRLLHGQSWYRDMKGSQIWEHLRRADELSGIGSFGVLLMGFNDGRRLDEPVPGALGGGTQFDTGGEPLSRVGVYSGEKEGPQSQSQGGPGSGVNSHKIGNLVEPNKLTQGGLPQYRYDSQLLGTDAQYVGVQLSHDIIPPKGKGQQLDLLFLRAFDESLVQIVQYEADLRNPRFGLPVMYRITLNDPRELHSGIGLPLATIRVHWSRVIHLADNLGSSEIFGVPRMRPVFNRLIDLAKVYGASAQGYWYGAFMGLAFTTHPQLGGDVKIDVAQMRQQSRDYFKRLNRAITASGMNVQPLAPQVSDPTAQIKALLECIAMQLRVPMRVFMGSERGELASSQDMQAHNGRLAFRQNNYLTPRVIIPFVDRLISVGVLPEPNSKVPTANKRMRRSLIANKRYGWWTTYQRWLEGGNCGGYEVHEAERITVNVESKAEKRQLLLGLSQEADATDLYPQPEAYGGLIVLNEAPPQDATQGQGETDEDQAEDPTSDDDESDSTTEEASGGYVVDWPDMEALTDAEKAAIAQQLSSALATYVQSGAENVCPPAIFMSAIMRLDEETANMMIDAAMEALEDPSDRLTPDPMDQKEREKEAHETDQQGQQQGQEQQAESHDQNLQQGQEAHEKAMSEPPPDEADEEPPGKPTSNADRSKAEAFMRKYMGTVTGNEKDALGHGSDAKGERSLIRKGKKESRQQKKSDEIHLKKLEGKSPEEVNQLIATDHYIGAAMSRQGMKSSDFKSPPAGPMPPGSSDKEQTGA